MNIAVKLIAGFALVAILTFGAFLATPQRKAPEASFVTLGGENFTTSQLRGKVAVVNFWATWCPDCVREMPRIVEAHRKYAPRGLETIAVAVRDHPNRVADYAQKQRLPFKVALDIGDSVSQRFGDVQITPTTFIIDRKGRIVRRFVGEPNWQEFDRVVEKALAG